ncbi:MAG TPA: hypothetical protein VF828_03020 [Patescibacteria group bacterium]
MNRLLAVRQYSRIFFLIIAVLIILYIFLENYGSLRANFYYSSLSSHQFISGFSPADRVKPANDQGIAVSVQTDDLLYFSTKLLKNFNHAKIKITFKNPYPDQDIYLGFQDQMGWHFQSRLIDSPLLSQLDWPSSGSNPVIWQRQKKFDGLDDLLKNTPSSSAIGLYSQDNDLFTGSVTLPGYQPQKTITVINTPLRGKQTFYVYLKDEPLNLDILKQDLNWYADGDTLTASIYHGSQLIYSTVLQDDGITDGSRRLGSLQELNIVNPVEYQLPEGVYKIVLDTNSDVIIRNIKTNLHKIVFDSPLYLASNSVEYPGVVPQIYTNTLYTDAQSVNIKTVHPSSLQTISVKDQSYKLSDINSILNIPLNGPLNAVFVPKSDVQISATFGYLSFTPDQYFRPQPAKVLTITNPDDLKLVDYVIANYSQPRQDGAWQTATASFDISKAFIQNNKLSWLINIPGLRDSGRSIEIKEIDVELTKDKTLCQASDIPILSLLCRLPIFK